MIFWSLELGIWSFAARSSKEIELRLVPLGNRFLGFRRQGQLKPEASGEALTRLRRESLKVVAHKREHASHFGQMSFDSKSPAFQRGFPFPKQFSVAVEMTAIGVIFRGIIAQQSEVKEIGRTRQKFEWRQVTFIQRTGVGPDPADVIFFEQPNDLRAVPSAMAEFDREPKRFG